MSNINVSFTVAELLALESFLHSFDPLNISDKENAKLRISSEFKIRYALANNLEAVHAHTEQQRGD